MLAKYFPIIRNYVLSVSPQRKYNFYHQNTLLDAFRTNSRNIIGRNPSMVIPLLDNQDLTHMLDRTTPMGMGGMGLKTGKNMRTSFMAGKLARTKVS